MDERIKKRLQTDTHAYTVEYHSDLKEGNLTMCDNVDGP